MNDEIGIYIHIPFCMSKCFYCNFCSFEKKDAFIDKYIDAVICEILSYSELLSNKNISTVYIGGGTPTYIDSKYIVKILNVLSMFYKSKPKEITIECNPNSLSDEKIKDYMSANINRFSIGLQSTENNILKSIGRTHTFEDYVNALKLLKENGALNISTDLIYPLPYLALDIWKSSLEKIINLSKDYPLTHISIYNLEIHEGSKLEFLIKEGYLKICDEDEEYQMKEYLEETLSKNMYNKYEISNYALKGYESKHNLSYWQQKQYIGIGLNSSSFLNGKRYKNTDNINDYISFYLDRKENIPVIIEENEMNKLELMKEYVMLGFRITDGININSFKNRFKVDIYDIFKNELDELEKKALIAKNSKNIYLTKRGQELANIVFEQFV